MNTINKLKSKIKELQNYVEENTNFNIEIQSSRYPVSVSFYENQIDMFSDDVSDTAPSLCFIFDDEMRIITAENFKINETVFNKLKNLSKEVNRLYLHSFREEIDKVIVPMWECINSTAQVALYNKKHFDRAMNVGDTQ
jgi:hypothetical protein